MTTWVMTLAAAVTVVLLAACSSQGSTGAIRPTGGTPTTTSTTSTTSTATTSTSAPAVSVPVTKLLVVMVENHSLRQMRTGMPWTFRQAQRYGYATRYHAITHPSLPNYLAIAGGSTFGVTDDHDPSAHPVRGHSVFGQALGSGHTAKLYAESMPAPCALTSSGRYAVRHNPWAYSRGERTACHAHDVAMSRLAGDVTAGTLPDAGMLIPNLCSDAHDCTLGHADDWLHRVVGNVMQGPDFTSGRLAVVITADEDDHNQGNRVLTTVLQRSLHGKVVTSPLSHYSLTGLYDDVLGTARLRKAAGAPSMARAFGLPTA
ncbi:MAG: alkaline phosphatase family protein [Nocardioides sp.]